MMGVVNTLSSLGEYSQSQRYLTVGESERVSLSRELYETYNGGAKKYIDEKIKQSFKSPSNEAAMLSMVVPYPFLEKLIKKLSRVYKTQPKRRFYRAGREIVPNNIEQDIEDILIDPVLYDILSQKFYSIENRVKIRESERKTNLLNTTIYKCYMFNGRISFDFIRNDLVKVVPYSESLEVAKEIEYKTTFLTTERWTADSFKNDEQSGKNETGAVIGWGFSPFVVFRDSISDGDFWAFRQKDLIEIVKQINVKFAELSYLIRYASFGLKYAVNLELPSHVNFDPVGILDVKSIDQSMDSENFDIGELKNSSSLLEVRDSIIFLITMLLYNYGINTQDIVGSAQKSTAESKELDREEYREYISEQKQIWRLNESHLFDVMRSVWNRDNAIKIPDDVEIVIDYPEIEARDIDAEIREWVTMIDHDVKTAIDWIMAKDKELTKEKALVIFNENRRINDKYGSSDEYGDKGLNKDDSPHMKEDPVNSDK